MPTQHKQSKDRVYHWKHGWIPLDHQAAVQKYGSASLAQKHGFGHVAAKDLPRKDHITAHFDSNTGHFTLRDTRSGNTAKMTTRQADAHQRSGQQVTTIGQGGRISKTRAPAPAPAPSPSPPTPSPVRNSSRGTPMKKSAAERQAEESAASKTTSQLEGLIRVFERTEGAPHLSAANAKRDRINLEALRAEYKRRTQGSGPAKEPDWMIRGMKRTQPTHSNAYDNANPAYDPRKMETFINCAKSVQAYELRRRGYDVRAQTHSAGMPTGDLARLWVNKETGNAVRVQQAKSKEDLEQNVMGSAPPGARFHVAVVWKGTPPGSPSTSAHIFNAEKGPDGKIRYFDAQVRRRSVPHYFTKAELQSHSISAYRVDDAIPSKDPRWTGKIIQKN